MNLARTERLARNGDNTALDDLVKYAIDHEDVLRFWAAFEIVYPEVRSYVDSWCIGSERQVRVLLKGLYASVLEDLVEWRASDTSFRSFVITCLQGTCSDYDNIVRDGGTGVIPFIGTDSGLRPPAEPSHLATYLAELTALERLVIFHMAVFQTSEAECANWLGIESEDVSAILNRAANAYAAGKDGTNGS